MPTAGGQFHRRCTRRVADALLAVATADSKLVTPAELTWLTSRNRAQARRDVEALCIESPRQPRRPASSSPLGRWRDSADDGCGGDVEALCIESPRQPRRPASSSPLGRWRDSADDGCGGDVEALCIESPRQPRRPASSSPLGRWRDSADDGCGGDVEALCIESPRQPRRPASSSPLGRWRDSADDGCGGDVEALCIELATAAFASDPFYLWLEPNEQRRRGTLTSLMGVALARSSVAVRTSDEQVIGLVAVHDPDLDRLGGPSVPWKALRHLAWRPRAWAALGFYRRLLRTRPTQPHVNIEVLAVAAAARGQGVARQLLEPILQAAEARALVVHLETTNPANVPLYRRFGFVVTHEITHSAITAWAMQRVPQGTRQLAGRDVGPPTT